jgi:hypothetical protein
MTPEEFDAAAEAGESVTLNVALHRPQVQQLDVPCASPAYIVT